MRVLLKSHGRDVVRLCPRVCSGLTRLVRAGYSRHDSGASRVRARITRRAQDGSVHMQRRLRSLPSSSYPARSTLKETKTHIKFTFIMKYSLLRTTSESLNKIRQRIRKLQLFEI